MRDPRLWVSLISASRMATPHCLRLGGGQWGRYLFTSTSQLSLGKVWCPKQQWGGVLPLVAPG